MIKILKQLKNKIHKMLFSIVQVVIKCNTWMFIFAVLIGDCKITYAVMSISLFLFNKLVLIKIGRKYNLLSPKREGFWSFLLNPATKYDYKEIEYREYDR
jgi:hypothetical protein